MLADNILAIACAVALYDLAVAHERRPDQLLAEFGLTRARVSSVIVHELHESEHWRAACRPDELEAVARKRGLDADGLSRWLRDVRGQHATQPDVLAGVAGVVLVGSVLIYLLAGLRSNEPDFDAFASRGLERPQIVDLVRRTSERLFSASSELAVSWNLIDATETTQAAPAPAKRGLYLVSDHESEASVLEQRSPAQPGPHAQDDDRPAVGVLIARLRAERGLSRAELAARAGLSVSTIRGIEVGERDAKIGSAKALAAALELPFVQFAAMIGADS